MNKLILLFLMLSVSARAAHVIDNAQLLDPSMESKLAPTHVYVETQKAIVQDIRAYANSRVVECAGTNGFLIVVTLQPRQWRIAMLPAGRVPESVVMEAGETLVKHFRDHDGSGGVLAAAEILEPKKSNSGAILFIIGGVVGLILVVWVVVLIYLACEVKTEKQKESKSEPNRKLTPDETKEAEELLSSYTPKQRARIEHHYHNSSYGGGGFGNDMFLWWLMFHNNDSSRQQIINVQPEPHYTPEPERHSGNVTNPAPSSSDYGISSSSDSFGGGGSWDSGSSSSFDSGSSGTDGGGGSW